MYLLYVYEYLGSTCVYRAHRGQKRSLDHLQLELWMVVSYHVDAGNSQGPLQEQHVCLTLSHDSRPCPIVLNKYKIILCMTEALSLS